MDAVVRGGGGDMCWEGREIRRRVEEICAGKVGRLEGGRRRYVLGR